MDTGLPSSTAIEQAPPSVASGVWTMLIYTVPAQPTRKRAAVWREVKRLGALYLRDGVCALPDTEAARSGLQALADRVLELEGQATLIWGAQLTDAVSAALHTQLAAARQTEYSEVTQAAQELRQHIRSEAAHHAFERAVGMSFSGDLTRLERWLAQIIARDYLQVGDPSTVAATLAECRGELQDHTPSLARTLN